MYYFVLEPEFTCKCEWTSLEKKKKIFTSTIHAQIVHLPLNAWKLLQKAQKTIKERIRSNLYSHKRRGKNDEGNANNWEYFTALNWQQGKQAGRHQEGIQKRAKKSNTNHICSSVRSLLVRESERDTYTRNMRNYVNQCHVYCKTFFSSFSLTLIQQHFPLNIPREREIDLIQYILPLLEYTIDTHRTPLYTHNSTCMRRSEDFNACWASLQIFACGFSKHQMCLWLCKHAHQAHIHVQKVVEKRKFYCGKFVIRANFCARHMSVLEGNQKLLTITLVWWKFHCLNL